MSYTRLDADEEGSIGMEGRADVFSQFRFTKKWYILIKQWNKVKHRI